MKPIIYLCIFCLSIFTQAQEKEIPVDKVPQDISNYIKKHFPDSKIVKLTEENTKFGTEYNVSLDNKIELDFDHKNQLEDIESKSMQELPNSVVPKNVWDYAKANYLTQQIIGWEKENKKQRLDLSNGWVLEFNEKGIFLGIKK